MRQSTPASPAPGELHTARFLRADFLLSSVTVAGREFEGARVRCSACPAVPMAAPLRPREWEIGLSRVDPFLDRRSHGGGALSNPMAVLEDVEFTRITFDRHRR